MGADEYNKALGTAEAELAQVTAKIELLEQRRAQLQQTVGALKTLTDVAQDEERTLTDTIRIVVRAAKGYITAAEVIKGAYAMGAKFGGKNPISTVVTILSRLHKDGELERDVLTGGYKWKTAPYLPPVVQAAMNAARNKK
ncbi:MAG: hypothetical protein ACR2IF_16680 [Terriglobales bacterium]